MTVVELDGTSVLILKYDLVIDDDNIKAKKIRMGTRHVATCGLVDRKVYP